MLCLDGIEELFEILKISQGLELVIEVVFDSAISFPGVLGYCGSRGRHRLFVT